MYNYYYYYYHLNIRQTKAMTVRWLLERYKLIGLVASEDDIRNQLTLRFVIVIDS